MEEREDEHGNYHAHGLSIPAFKLNALKFFVEHGTLPGGFMQAVISNDLRGAVERADELNLPLIPAYVNWLYNEAPAPCWGSHKKMVEWANRKQTERKS